MDAGLVWDVYRWVQSKFNTQIRQSHQRIGSRAYAFKTDNTLSVELSILYIKMIVLISILFIKNTN